MIKKAFALTLSLLTLSAQAQSDKPLFCVWDILGKSGDIYNLMLDQSLHMAKLGMPFELRAYTDERVAVEDYRAGQCAGVVSTGFRARPFNAISGSMDSMGSALVIKGGKVDMAGSLDVMRRVITAFSSPQAAKLMREGQHEVGGILPVGAAYPMIRDRTHTRLDQLAGKRIGVFDQDKPQALLIQQLGAQAVSLDISNVGTKFNNGLVDMIHLPAITYKPFELAKGMGTQGTVVRVPAMFPTVQMVFNADKLPTGFGEASRQFWLAKFDRQIQDIQRAEASIPTKVWSDVEPQVLASYVASLKEGRLIGAKQGLYAKRTLNLFKKARCAASPENAECAVASEVD
ncbi:MAG TPA: putative solute-binding protein [Aquabacterium sp.]|uniref:putative solute-binding protein n=1 Tax=Aquabacterium sp. TaxID=1872578 RepID=UPI002E36A5CB|nr:putative solute-binding protein [Aquabacterium sp.]HEX5374328.1 putative solute-binding protein [Aquabacterium sp.]